MGNLLVTNADGGGAQAHLVGNGNERLSPAYIDTNSHVNNHANSYTNVNHHANGWVAIPEPARRHARDGVNYDVQHNLRVAHQHPQMIGQRVPAGGNAMQTGLHSSDHMYQYQPVQEHRPLYPLVPGYGRLCQQLGGHSPRQQQRQLRGLDLWGGVFNDTM